MFFWGSTNQVRFFGHFPFSLALFSVFFFKRDTLLMIENFIIFLYWSHLKHCMGVMELSYVEINSVGEINSVPSMCTYANFCCISFSEFWIDGIFEEYKWRRRVLDSVQKPVVLQSLSDLLYIPFFANMNSFTLPELGAHDKATNFLSPICFAFFLWCFVVVKKMCR